jgi:hypothetical protein
MRPFPAKLKSDVLTASGTVRPFKLNDDSRCSETKASREQLCPVC